MKFTRFWPAISAPPPSSSEDEPAESIEAGEPGTGTLSLEQLMESLSPSNAPFDPDSTAHFSVDDLLLRRDQLEGRLPATPSASVAPEPRRMEVPSMATPAPATARQLSPITKVSLVLLLPALALLILPKSRAVEPSSEATEPSAIEESVALAPSASVPAVAPQVALAKPEGALEVHDVDAKGVTAERGFVDRLAAGEFARALEEYGALAKRSPAHAAALRILQRKLKAARQAQ